MNLFRNIIILITVVVSFPLFASSQDEFGFDLEETGILYRKEMSYGFVVHSEGWGLNYRRGKHVTGSRKLMWDFELLSMKHPKEVKSINPFFDNSKSFVYGKLNSFFLLRTGIGSQKVINEKPIWGGVQVRYAYYGGISMGITKPVYLYILNFTSVPFEYLLTVERYDPNKHFLDNIYGRGPFFKGFDRVRFHPGLYVKGGLNFEYGAYDEDVRALEVGFAVDAYPKSIPIMAYNENNQIFVSLYLGFHFGKRGN